MNDFSARFGLTPNLLSERKRFVNRIENQFFDPIDVDQHYRHKLREVVANALGLRFNYRNLIPDYTQHDFLKTLHACEALLDALDVPGLRQRRVVYSNIIIKSIRLSETDLGIRFNGGVFFPKGADELDKPLVLDSLRWLRELGQNAAADAFEKALTHFLSANNDQAKLGDVITDAYEAVESTAKQLTGKDKDLSSLRESLVKQLQLSKDFIPLFKAYIEYGCKFRHGQHPDNPRSLPSVAEAEAFIYQSGIMLRLMVMQLRTKLGVEQDLS